MYLDFKEKRRPNPICSARWLEPAVLFTPVSKFIPSSPPSPSCFLLVSMSVSDLLRSLDTDRPQVGGSVFSQRSFVCRCLELTFSSGCFHWRPENVICPRVLGPVRLRTNRRLVTSTIQSHKRSRNWWLRDQVQHLDFPFLRLVLFDVKAKKTLWSWELNIYNKILTRPKTPDVFGTRTYVWVQKHIELFTAFLLTACFSTFSS